MPVRPRVPPKKLSAAVRRKKIIDLRVAGCTLDQIAEQLKTNRFAISRTLVKILEEIQKDNEAEAMALKTLELERIDMAMLAIAANVRAGHLGAMDKWIKLIALRCQILGLNKPTGDASAIQRVYQGVDIDKV